MVLFKQNLPRMLGIGIDETTAIVVTGRNAEVMGAGKVAFFDGDTAEEAEVRTEVSAGQIYDLIERRVLDPASP
jgi:cyanophycinase-like exopeptidase